MFKRIFIGFADRIRAKELESFMEVLTSADADEIAFTLCCAMDLRNEILDKSDHDLMDPAVIGQQDPLVLISLSQTAVNLQKKGDLGKISAAAYMVWIHTLRAMETPRIRNRAREMWRELSLGFKYKKEGAQTFEDICGFSPNLTDWGILPNGLGDRS